MYYFEKISSSARDEVMVKSDLLENLTKDLETNVRELQGEKSGQENTRKAIMNILEDTIDLDKELKIEKQSIERKVVERTAELKKANNEVNKGWFQIREEKAKLVASINSIVRAYVLVGLDGKIELVNNRMSEFFGEVEGNWTLDMIQEKVGSKFDILQLYNKAKNEHQKTEVKEIEIAGKYYDVHVSPIFLSPEKLIGVLLMFGDITEQKIIDRSKDEFFSIASHELRTPLTAIRGNSSLIKDLYLEKIKDQDLVEMINDIHESSVRLIGIVNDFLNVSRLEMGKMQFKKEPFDINSLVQKTIDEIDDKNDQVKIQTTKGKTDIINVVGDSDRAKEVLINIIGNAVKFSEKGVVTVDFKVDSKEVTILVTDSGRGIAPENQNLLFHKFQQAGDNLLTRDTTKSTGLGLYISKLMAEGMGGKIWLEKSELGRGSTFAFSLPTAI